MTITAILNQPDNGALLPSHRPIVFIVRSGGVVPTNWPAYCDVYIGGVFYRTLTTYSYERTNFGTDDHSIFRFDIQDTLQEYLQTYVFTTPPTVVTRVADGTDTLHYNSVQCKFRGSSFDDDGILIPQPTIPVEGTDTSDPVPGTGTASHTFKVMKATLRTLDNPDLQVHLDNLRLPARTVGGTPEYFYAWPLSNLPYNPAKHSLDYPGDYPVAEPTNKDDKAVDIYYGDHGWFPVYIPFGLSGSSRIWVTFYTGPDTPNYDIAYPASAPDVAIAGGIWYLPIGQIDLINHPGASSTLLRAAFANTDYTHYRVVINQAIVGTDYNQWFVTPMFRNRQRGYQNSRIWFQNNFGVFEQVSFIHTDESFKTTSSDKFIPLSTGTDFRLNTATGHRRYNVTANDETEVTAVFTEALMPWIKELLATSIAYVEVQDPEQALSDGPASLVPINITDASVATVKSEERYNYQVKLKYTKAIDNINLRN